MADNHSKEVRSMNMSHIKSTDTKPEVIVRKYLFSKGLRYRKVCVFINGCFWHQHSGCRYAAIPKSNQEYWIPKLQRNVERDKTNIEKLTQNGWKVSTVWECELKKDCLFDTLEKLYDSITKSN